MINLIIEFIARCNSVNITPAEREIDAYLMSVDRLDLRQHFIKFCFYNWEKRNDENFINNLIEIC